MTLRALISGAVLAGLVSISVEPAAQAAQATLPAQVNGTPVPSLAPMIKKVSPTVVNIATRGTIKERGPSNPLLEDPFFRRFFEMPPDFGQRERQFQSAGSGVIVDAKNGYVITNAHVVTNANEITVSTQDGRELKADVVGSDTGSDIAVLKLKKAADLSALVLGDSSKLEVGDFVVAIGNPFGLSHTVTSGIVSALGRVPNINPEGYEDFIQTDASINPGNSGGALVNLNGELIGINSAILSRSGGNIGIGFAIPVNMVKSVMDQLIQHGEVKRGVLGVQLATQFTPDVAKNLGLENAKGALVAQVVPGSAADKAGVKVGDVIVSVNGHVVANSAELRNMIGLIRIGSSVELGLLREGKPRKVTAVVAERTRTETQEAQEIHRGLEGADLADAGGESGVTVRAVVPSSPAAQFGLQAKDVIVGVNRLRIRNLQQLREIAKEADSLVLNVQRGNMQILVLIR